MKVKRKVAKRSTNGASKMDMAKKLYGEMKNKPRKDVLVAFMSKAGLTKAGASTYYQICRTQK